MKKSKAIVITGGGRGIGYTTIKKLLSTNEFQNTIIISLDLDNQNLKNLENVVTITLNLKDIKKLTNVLEKLSQQYKIIGLVNNAGKNDGIGLDASLTDFIDSLRNNLFHYFLTVKHFRNNLITNKGSIVNISSKVAITGQGKTSAYVAAKGAILSLTREWAKELAPYGVRVNAVIPAEVQTPLYKEWLSTLSNKKQIFDKIKKSIPLEHRLAKPEEIANVIVFLLSQKASYITGQWLFVDGGYTFIR